MWDLAVDLGTREVKAARSHDGIVEPVALAGRPSMPAAVYLDDDGSIRSGWDALDRGALVPERLELTPRRWLANGSTLVLGGSVHPVAEALAAVLGRVVREAAGVVGTQPGRLVLSRPAAWPAGRSAVLVEAAARIGFDSARLVAEPEAAIAGGPLELPVGARAAVFDLGAGTLGVSVVERTPSGPRLVGRPGGHERMGGDIFDDRLQQLVGQRVAAEDPASWHWLTTDQDRRWQRARLALRTSVRHAREQLSGLTTATVAVPALGRSVPVERSRFEQVVAREVDQAVAALLVTLEEAGTTADGLHHVLVVGGATRTPLVQWALLTRFGERVVFAPDPERTLAVGLVRLLAAPSPPTPAHRAAQPETQARREPERQVHREKVSTGPVPPLPGDLRPPVAAEPTPPGAAPVPPGGAGQAPPPLGDAARPPFAADVPTSAGAGPPAGLSALWWVLAAAIVVLAAAVGAAAALWWG